MSELTASAAAWVKFFRDREAQGFGPARYGLRPTSRRNLLRLIRSVSPAAYAAITNPPEPVVRFIRQPDTGEVLEITA